MQACGSETTPTLPDALSRRPQVTLLLPAKPYFAKQRTEAPDSWLTIMSPVLLALTEGRTPPPPAAETTFDALCRAADAATLENYCEQLDEFRRTTTNFYHGVRAIFFLAAIHRYHLPTRFAKNFAGLIPYEGHKLALARRFEEAIGVYHAHRRAHGPGDALSSAFAAAYHGLAFKTLAAQVQKTVRKVRGNQWMFRVGHPLDYPLRLRR